MTRNPEAEEMLLSMTIQKPVLFEELMAAVTVDHFSSKFHQDVFAVMMELDVINERSIASRAREQGLLSGPWVADLSTLSRAAVTASKREFGFWMEKLKIAYNEKRLVQIAERVVNRASDPEMPVAEKIAALTEDIFQLAAGAAESGEMGMKEALHQAIREMDEMQNGSRAGIPTGLGCLDAITGGLMPGEVTVVAARPSEGKTSLLTNMAVAAARAGHGVAFVTAEMRAPSIAKRMLAEVAQVDGMRIRQGMLSQKRDLPRVMGAVNALKDCPIIFEQTSGITIEQVILFAQKCKRVHDTKLLVVDYMQFLDISNKRFDLANDTARVGYISGCLAKLARELDIPIVVAAQLNREADGTEPMLKHLRSAGGIEQDASVVLFPYRPDVEDYRRYKLVIAKNREGAKQVLDISFDPPTTTFSDAPAGWESSEE